jgi:DNA-binding transcriptional ArsR family regulator
VAATIGPVPQRVADLDRVFQALADPTRRAVVERLGRGSAATSELARPFSMALPSFLQHLDVLAKAGLVTSTKSGRVRTFQLTPQSLQTVDDWMTRQRRLWERRLDQFDEYVRTLKETEHQ